VYPVFDAARTNQIDLALQAVAVDDDFDDVAVAHFADGAAGQRLGRNVADAGAGGDAAETRVGDHRHVLAEIQVAWSAEVIW
jgi:hypothetical protein